VGNSSSGIREASFMGVPSVNIGERQLGRERTPNVVDVNYDKEEIKKAIIFQANNGIYEKDFTYGDGKSGHRMAKILSQIDTSRLNKKFHSIL
jgi:UDP-N-acetylglucosamine 2-epimerase